MKGKRGLPPNVIRLRVPAWPTQHGRNSRGSEIDAGFLED
jgi:hypothetical protein